jgi:peptidyl-prolyl cis-trans isomerase SurA
MIMIRTILITGLAALLFLHTQAQTIFTYGNNKVDKNEFWRAFSKNNTGAKDEKSIREYLDLYIRFKLKVQAAKDNQLDTLPNIKSDVAGFRAQLIEQFLKQQPYTKQLAEEAFERNQYELEIEHVFVGFETDSLAAKTKIEKAYKELQNGADFTKTVLNYSTTEAVKVAKGYIGFISTLMVPYSIENAIYNLRVGSYTAPLKSSKGYHIIRLINKRKSAGTLKAAHILFALPPNAGELEKQEAKAKADSVYQLLQNGLSFEKAAEQFSNDKTSYMSGGALPEFSYCKYEAAFSNAAFRLKKDQEISAPVLTGNGWHIIQRISFFPLKTELNNELEQEWMDKIINDERLAVSQMRLYEEMKKATGYKQLPYASKQLWQLTDSMLQSKNYAAFYKTYKSKPLFLLKNKTISVADWMRYAKSRGTIPDSSVASDYSDLMKSFVHTTIEQYYKDRYETFNEAFRYQLKEFSEGSLLFEVMERTIWSKAPGDSIGLANYYQKHQSKYKWQPSSVAIIFNCADTTVAKEAWRLMKNDPSKWKDHMESFGGNALADSGRFEYAQLPIDNPEQIKAGNCTPVMTNANDGSSSFCYIIKVIPQQDQRSFEEAKGLVINDYQILLEDQWLAQLKKKYPVLVNEQTLKSLLKP